MNTLMLSPSEDDIGAAAELLKRSEDQIGHTYRNGIRSCGKCL